ncbi:MAG: adenylate cyclase [Actinomycetota bacterium]
MTDGPDRAKEAKEHRQLLLARFGIANAVGAVLVFAYFTLLAASVTGPALEFDHYASVSLIVFVAFIAVIGPAGYWAGTLSYRTVERWLASDRPPDAEERRAALSQPAKLAALTFAGWVVAAAVFATLNAILGSPGRDIVRTIAGTLLAGVACAAVCYLLSERFLRPVFARVLEGEPPDRPTTLGITPRLVLSWALGSAVPLIGIAIAPLTPAENRANLLFPIVLLAAIGLIAGSIFVALAAKSVAEPIESVRAGLERVESGDLDTSVPVDDGGEIGLLQAGFNRMAEGLREREQLRDLFGRYVGEEVARQAVEQAAGLGGELRDVSALFVDLVGSTTIAQERPPTQVVAMLNEFFGTVVRVVAAEGGWVNKFEGDGALCVFGAPADQPDHAARALRAARKLGAALGGNLPAGIGVSSGPAVAGNVGAEQRYEYTVIGDPVNEAARLTEAAKQHPTHVLASEASVERAGDEAAHWMPVGTFELRGRSAPTTAYAPAQTGEAATALQARATPSSSTS